MDFPKRNFWQEEERNAVIKPKKQRENVRKDVLDSVYPIFGRYAFSDNTLLQSKYRGDWDAKGLVFSDVNEELHCFYAIRKRFGFEMVNSTHLNHWDLNAEKLHERAISNFRNFMLTDLCVFGDTHGMLFKLDGNLEAGLMLIDEIWEQIEEQLGERVVIAVPSRGVVVATGESNVDTIATLDTLVQSIYKEGGYPLSKEWFIRNAGKWTAFDFQKSLRVTPGGEFRYP